MRESKEAFRAALAHAISYLHDETVSIEAKRVELVTLHQAFICHINHAESSIAQESLTGAIQNSRWRHYRSDTASNILTEVPKIYQMIEEWCVELGLDFADFLPGRTAMAELQRVVVEIDPGEAKRLHRDFAKQGLPTHGFATPAVGHQSNQPQSSTASVQYHDSGGLSRVDGLTSGDAMAIATTIAHKGEKTYSAPAEVSPASELIGHHSQPWLRQQLDELRKSPAKVIVLVISGILIATLTALGDCGA